ncbi:MAG: hypothetical protein WC635_02530 [Bacteriovorax sp.]|jgi:hypothetical protein
MNYLKTFLPYLFGNKKGKSLEHSIPEPSLWETLSFEERLMFHSLKNSLNQFIRSIDLKALTQKEIYHLFNFLDFLKYDLKEEVKLLFSNEYRLFSEATKAKAISKNDLQELLDFKNGKLTVFAILTHDRQRPGILVVRKPDGSFVSFDESKIWSIPVLGLSGRGLPFHHSNGSTPAGVYTIDSVMPEANKPFEFGKFRRLIVNFIPKTENEETLKSYLPDNHREKSWWKASVLGRELGRSLLRIHGTGRVNPNPLTTFFPLVPTSGCLATNEASLFGFKASQDQRLLLDTLMSALNLPKTAENESKIHGLLYVIDFDDNLTALRF